MVGGEKRRQEEKKERQEGGQTARFKSPWSPLRPYLLRVAVRRGLISASHVGGSASTKPGRSSKASC